MALSAMSMVLVVPAAAGDRDATAMAPVLSIVTLNLWHDKGDWPKREAQIVSALRDLQADVIALQEVIQRETLPNQAQSIADMLGYEAYFVSTDPVGKPVRYGNAILTRHPILARDSQLLQPLDDFRTAAHLRLAIGDRPVNIYVTHLHYTDEGGAIRERQLRDLEDFIARTRGDAPVLIAGDFNARVTQPEMRSLAKAYIDAYGTRHADAEDAEHGTLNPAYFAVRPRIDHVFAQRGRFIVEGARIILNHADAQGVWPSDHFGVQVSLRLMSSAP